MNKDQIKIDKDICIGCGSCVAMAPKTFVLNKDGKAEVLDNVGDDDSAIETSMSICPVQVIKIVK